MEEVTARVYLVSISRSRYSAVYVGGHAKTALLHAAISAAAHQMCEMLMNVQFRFCRDERSELPCMPWEVQHHCGLELIIYKYFYQKHETHLNMFKNFNETYPKL